MPAKKIFKPEDYIILYELLNRNVDDKIIAKIFNCTKSIVSYYRIKWWKVKVNQQLINEIEVHEPKSY